MKRKNESKRNSLSESIKSLNDSIKALYRLSPFFILVFLVINFYLIIGVSKTTFFTIFAIIIILFVSILIYVKSQNFGEASLSLAAGILSVFSITWESNIFIAFAVTWVCFASFSLLYSSIRLAAKIENLTIMASLRIDSNNYKTIQKELNKIRESKNNKLISPVEACNAQLLMAYNGISLELFSVAMNRIEEMRVITGIDYRSCTEFIIDLINISGNLFSFNKYFNDFFLIIRDSPYLPIEIFAFIKRTKFYILTGNYKITQYINKLRSKLKKGYDLSKLEQELMD